MTSHIKQGRHPWSLRGPQDPVLDPLSPTLKGPLLMAVDPAEKCAAHAPTHTMERGKLLIAGRLAARIIRVLMRRSIPESGNTENAEASSRKFPTSLGCSGTFFLGSFWSLGKTAGGNRPSISCRVIEAFVKHVRARCQTIPINSDWFPRFWQA